ncbi:MAG: hypothetical protein ACRDO2_00545 [Nocardioidaceae bacterium]
MSEDAELTPLSDEELNAQEGTALPDKEVVSILDLNADLALSIDAAAPIDLAVAANANVAAPIDAAVGANILSTGSEAQALADQGVIIDQGIDADATANAVQDSTIGQANDVIDDGSTSPVDGGAATDAATTSGAGETAGTAEAGAAETTAGTVEPTTVDPTLPDTGVEAPDTSALLDGNLLNVDVNLDADADIAAPIDGAVAANANVAAPIDAAVAANVGSVDSQAAALAQQDAIITQDVTGSAEANAEQTSEIEQ